MKIDPRNLLILLLLGFIAWQVVERPARGSRQGGGGDAARGIIAVTGSYGSGADALYLFDTKTRQLAVYRVKTNGRALELVAARDCTYDFFLQAYNDVSAEAFLPRALRRGWQKINQPAADKELSSVPAGKKDPREAPGGVPNKGKHK